MRFGISLVLLLCAAAAQAQTMYKCMDSQNRVTYSNITCEKQGLREGGPVSDRVTSMPFTEPPKPKPGAIPTVKLPVPPEDAEPARGGAQVRPVNPQTQKLLK